MISDSDVKPEGSSSNHHWIEDEKNLCVMSHKKAGGSTRLGRDSNPQYLGTKVADGEVVKNGGVIVRQRGTKIHPGKNVKKGKDDTLFSIVNGIVKFTNKKMNKFDGSLKKTRFANVIPHK